MRVSWKPGATSRIGAARNISDSTATFEVLDSPAYRAALLSPTDWSTKNLARFKNMIRTIARITVSRGEGRGTALGVVRIRPTLGTEDELRETIREKLDPEQFDGVISMHLIESDPILSKPLTDDPPVSDPGAGDWFVLVDAINVNAVSTAIAARFTGPEAFAKGTLVTMGSYALIWDVARSDIRLS